MVFFAAMKAGPGGAAVDAGPGGAAVKAGPGGAAVKAGPGGAAVDAGRPGGLFFIYKNCINSCEARESYCDCQSD